MQRPIPFSRLLEARAAFIRALASQTDAIREVYDWRLPVQARDTERERRLREFVAADSDLTGFYSGRDGTVREYRRSDFPRWQRTVGNDAARAPASSVSVEHFDRSWFGLSREHIADLAGQERASAAFDWARRWRVGEVLWLREWVLFALLWWDLCRSCTVPDCSRGCSAATGEDVDRALALVLSPEILLDIENANGTDWNLSLSEHPEGGGAGTILGGGEHIPSGFKPVTHPLMGPHPLLETEQEFLDRARRAWGEAFLELKQQSLEFSVPRKLELHCEWLVRRHVCGHTAAEILGSDDTDLSTVYKATDAMSTLLGLRIRQDLN